MLISAYECLFVRLILLLFLILGVSANIFRKKRRACGVCRKWKEGVKLSLGRRESLSFAGWKMDDYSTARLIHHAYSLRQLDM